MQADHPELTRAIQGLAHELNNPNAYVRMSASNLQKLVRLAEPLFDDIKKHQEKKTIGPYEVDDYVNKMLEQVQSILQATVRISVISDRLKNLCDASHEKKAPLSLETLLETLPSTHDYLFMNGVQFKIPTDIDPHLKVMGNRMQLEQALSILVCNAVDALEENPPLAPATPKIMLEVEHSSDSLLLFIKDNGPGISQENLAKIFTPYFTTKPQGKGDGLGLSICRSIIEAHDGTLDVISEKGKGSTFIISLNLYKDEKELAS